MGARVEFRAQLDPTEATVRWDDEQPGVAETEQLVVVAVSVEDNVREQAAVLIAPDLVEHERDGLTHQSGRGVPRRRDTETVRRAVVDFRGVDTEKPHPLRATRSGDVDGVAVDGVDDHELRGRYGARTREPPPPEQGGGHHDHDRSGSGMSHRGRAYRYGETVPRASRIVVIVVAAIVALTIAGALASRPGLERARRDTDQAWQVVRIRLDARYQALQAAGDATNASLGAARDPLPALSNALAAWERVRRGAASRIDAQVLAANRVEGVAARLRTVVTATPKLRGNADIAHALEAFDRADPGRERRVYNDAVSHYEHDRGGTFIRVFAGVLGFDARPAFVLP